MSGGVGVPPGFGEGGCGEEGEAAVFFQMISLRFIGGNGSPVSQRNRFGQRDGESSDRTERRECGDDFVKVSRDAWKILIDKAETEAYDKISMVPKGQGVVA